MTLTEIVEQLRSCNFECEAGSLENNAAYKELVSWLPYFDDVRARAAHFEKCYLQQYHYGVGLELKLVELGYKGEEDEVSLR